MPPQSTLRRALFFAIPVATVTLLSAVRLGAQEAPRGLRMSTAGLGTSYVYFGSIFGRTTYLVDMGSGDVVHAWETDHAPAGSVYLLDNGHLLRGARASKLTPFRGGGLGGRLQELTWSGEVVWDFVYANEDHALHHDIELLPNGNILAIAWEAKSREEAQAMGFRPEMTPERGIWPDKVVELEPRPPGGARIVWEWHAWDHMIQDLDPGLGNYGDPSEHPELIDINANRAPPEDMTEENRARYRGLGFVPDEEDFSPPSDHMHTNAIAYNADLDQIALSVPNYNEIWIIDHSTTTQEAAGHAGGRHGRGGDLLYRWGNPQTYGRGGPDDQRLGFEHDVKWIPDGMPGAGNLTVFNNRVPGGDGAHSAVFEIAPPVDNRGRYRIAPGEAFGPGEPVWSYVALEPTSFYSSFISGAHRLPDGNTLITSGAQGRFFEVTPAGEIVWEYLSPTSGAVLGPDGTVSATHRSNPYAVFRATKISANHPALRGRTLEALEPQPTFVPPPDAGR
jgi:hypothetical protein